MRKKGGESRVGTVDACREDEGIRAHAASFVLVFFEQVVLIADAPMHGIGEYGDGFREGSPDGSFLRLSVLDFLSTSPLVASRTDLDNPSSSSGKDPLELARQMASQGITML